MSAEARSQLFFQESAQVKARLVHLQVLRVVHFSRVREHLGFSFQECSVHQTQRRVNVNAQLPVGAAFLDSYDNFCPMVQLLSKYSI